MRNWSFFSGLWSAIFPRSSAIEGFDAGADGHASTLPMMGPSVNVDGTPMLNDAVDVMGKAYGDAGTFGGSTPGTDW